MTSYVQRAAVCAAAPIMLALAAPAALGQSAPAPSREAPILAERVAAGDLPQLAERLPETPRVVDSVDGVGRYGGTWRTGAREAAPTWPLRTIAYDHMTHWTPDWSGTVANIPESIEVNEDATIYTIDLRDGMRWSDGEPFDADDLMFAYEVWQHPDLAGFPEWMMSTEGPGVVEKVDADTVTVTFPSPNATFMDGMAQVTTVIGGDAFTKYPEHYMRRFHADHAEGDLDAEVADAGVSTWQELFTLRSDTLLNPDKPTLNAWVVTQPLGEGSRIVAERNPYYWKVDSAGNQLPYIDRVVFEVVQDPQVLLLKALAGEIDMIGTLINEPENKAVLFDSQERGDYRFFDMTPSDSNLLNFAFNQMHKDPAMRELLRDKQFRAALSHGIDRQEIIDLIFIGQATPMQTAVLPSYPQLYNERLATQFLDYDPDLANQMLDEAGYTERDAEGFRLREDGERLGFAILTRADKAFMADAGQMMVEDWKELGVDVRLDVVDRNLVRSRKNANDHDVIVEDFPGGARDALLRPTPWVPMHHNAAYGIPWYDWHRGEGGEEPPANIMRQFELWEQVNATADTEKRLEAMRQILENAADEFHNIGVAVPLSQYGIVSNNLRGVPETMPGSYWFAPPGPTNPPTYWFAESAN